MFLIIRSIATGQISASRMGALARMNVWAAGSVKYATARAIPNPAAVFSIVFESHFMVESFEIETLHRGRTDVRTQAWNY
ncbi:MAG: hypothetical protein ACREXQ_18100, partial [Polaromonas sp.]